MAIPEQVKVGAFDYSVDMEKPSNMDGMDGQLIGYRIRIAKGHSPLLAADTLVHEVMHAIWRDKHLQDDDGEERTVGALTTGLIGVLRDNPDLVKWLVQQVK